MGEVHVKLGKLLKLERERRNLALADLAADLKISEANLQHIEDGDPSALPGELYFTLFGRSYAEALGIDFAMTMEAIREDLGEPLDSTNGTVGPDGSPARPVKPLDSLESEPPQQTKPKVNIGSTVTIILLAVAAVIVWLWFAPDKKVMLFEKDRAAGAKEKSASELADSLAADSAASFNLNLKLVARDRAWATVLADSDTALATTLKPWREYTVGARETLLISLASPLSVDAFVNNRRVNLRDTLGAVEKTVVTLANVELYINLAIADSLAAASARADSIRADSIANDSTPHKAPDSLGKTTGAPRVTKPDTARGAAEPAAAGSPLTRLRKADSTTTRRDSAGGR